MNVQQLIAALHEAAGGDNNFYDRDVIIIVKDGENEHSTWYAEHDIDEVMLVNSQGKIAFRLGSSWRAHTD